MAEKRDVAEIIAGLTGEGRHYRFIRKPNGSIAVEAKGKEDHAHAMEAVEKIGTLASEPYIQQLMREAAQWAIATQHASALPSPSPTAAPGHSAFPSPASLAGIPALPIGKVVTERLSDVISGTVPKTLSIKRTAVEGFASHYGEKNSLRDAGRIDVGQWVTALRDGSLSKPTIVNKCCYLRGFFDWAKGYYPKSAKDDKPAAGQIVYGAREKHARRKHCFKAFTDAELQILYGPAFLAKLPSTSPCLTDGGHGRRFLHQLPISPRSKSVDALFIAVRSSAFVRNDAPPEIDITPGPFFLMRDPNISLRSVGIPLQNATTKSYIP